MWEKEKQEFWENERENIQMFYEITTSYSDKTHWVYLQVCGNST